MGHARLRQSTALTALLIQKAASNHAIPLRDRVHIDASRVHTKTVLVIMRNSESDLGRVPSPQLALAAWELRGLVAEWRVSFPPADCPECPNLGLSAHIHTRRLQRRGGSHFF